MRRHCPVHHAGRVGTLSGGRSSGSRIVLGPHLPAGSPAVVSRSLRPRSQRRVRAGLAPASLWWPSRAPPSAARCYRRAAKRRGQAAGAGGLAPTLVGRPAPREYHWRTGSQSTGVRMHEGARTAARPARRRTGGWKAARWVRRAVQIACLRPLRLPAVRGAAAPRRPPPRRPLLPLRPAGRVRHDARRARRGSALALAVVTLAVGARARPRLVRVDLPARDAARLAPLPRRRGGSAARPAAPPRRQVRPARRDRRHGGLRQPDAAGARSDRAAHAHGHHLAASPASTTLVDAPSRRSSAGGRRRRRRWVEDTSRHGAARLPAALRAGDRPVPAAPRGRAAQRLRRPVLVPLPLPARRPARAGRQGAGAAARVVGDGCGACRRLRRGLPAWARIERLRRRAAAAAASAATAARRRAAPASSPPSARCASTASSPARRRRR